jgi:aminomethyltransferase
MCNERGGVIDDLYAYQLSGGVYFLIINASRIEPDVAWLQAQAAKFLRRTQAHRRLAQLRRRGRARPAREGIHQRVHSRRVKFGHARQRRDRIEEKPDRRLSL